MTEQRADTLYFDGGWKTGSASDPLTIVDPTTGASVAELATAREDQVNAAAVAAGRAYAAWSGTPPAERAAKLRAVATAVARRKRDIAAKISREMGKPLPDAIVEIEGVQEVFEVNARAAEALGTERQLDTDDLQRTVRREGIGAVLVVGTWNFPVETLAVHAAPALAAGCPVIMVPNARTPLAALAFVDALVEADLPAGVIGFLVGWPKSLTNQLLDHDAVRHVSFTGSVGVGRAIATAAARNIKRATLELGGNAPAIVMPGADIALAATDLVAKRFWNAGQVCTSPNRIFVHRSIYAPFIDRFLEAVEGITVGAGEDDAMGPVASRDRIEAMNAIVSGTIAAGGQLKRGGRKMDGDGFFWEPTVLVDVPADAPAMSEEIFGPIAAIAPYDDLDGVIDLANDCSLGLGGYVYGPAAEATDVAERLEVGAAAVNQTVVAFTDAPFGGIKDSGLGHVGGDTAINDYLRERLVAVRRSPAA